MNEPTDSPGSTSGPADYRIDVEHRAICDWCNWTSLESADRSRCVSEITEHLADVHDVTAPTAEGEDAD